MQCVWDALESLLIIRQCYYFTPWALTSDEFGSSITIRVMPYLLWPYVLIFNQIASKSLTCPGLYMLYLFSEMLNDAYCLGRLPWPRLAGQSEASSTQSMSLARDWFGLYVHLFHMKSDGYRYATPWQCLKDKTGSAQIFLRKFLCRNEKDF